MARGSSRLEMREIRERGASWNRRMNSGNHSPEIWKEQEREKGRKSREEGEERANPAYTPPPLLPRNLLHKACDLEIESLGDADPQKIRPIFFPFSFVPTKPPSLIRHTSRLAFFSPRPTLSLLLHLLQGNRTLPSLPPSPSSPFFFNNQNPSAATFLFPLPHHFSRNAQTSFPIQLHERKEGRNTSSLRS
ncbi:hypothetical protein IE53DRAFT_81351 [Violaceomyces palustris]|uniref:Uncharacterized protein n=1 Tax=Violaceomyces palustris TaxID=1673888 RepID=A0ACD0NY58_9BASI|nr:hypothetical protein IE53DRAFT_81351 [Violaceomyces palustris]